MSQYSTGNAQTWADYYKVFQANEYFKSLSKAANEGRYKSEAMKQNYEAGLDTDEMDENIAAGAATSLINKWTGRGLTRAEISANEFSAWQAQEARDFEERMSNTAYQRQVADMQAAGVNPALTMGGASNGASVPSSPSPQSVTPANGSLSDLIALLRLPSELKRMNAETQNIKANTEKTTKEIPWIDRINQLQVDMGRKNMELTDEQIKNAESYRADLASQISLRAKQEDNEVLRGELLKAEKRLQEASADKIYFLMESEKALNDAKTETEKKQAAYLGIQYAYQKKLIDGGYIDQMVAKMKAEAELLGEEKNKVLKEIDLIAENIKTARRVNEIRFDGLTDWQNIGSVLISFFSMLSVAVRGR